MILLIHLWPSISNSAESFILLFWVCIILIMAGSECYLDSNIVIMLPHISSPALAHDSIHYK